MVSKNFWIGDRVRLTSEVRLPDRAIPSGALGTVEWLCGAVLTDDANYRVRFEDGTRADILSTFLVKANR